MSGTAVAGAPVSTRPGSGKRPFRLAILTSHVIQYQDPLFRHLAAHPDLDLEVLFCSRIGAETYRDELMGVTLKWDIEMLKGYRYRFLRNFGRAALGLFSRVNPGVVPAILRGRYDGVGVMGWGTLSTWLTFLACRLAGVPFFINGDTSFVEDPPTVRGRVRRAILGALFRRTSGFWVMGAMNGDFYRHFGADPGRFFHVPYAIDNGRFADGARQAAAERTALRARHGIAPDRVAIVFSGKLYQIKNPDHLILAMERMHHRDRAAIVYMGDGEDRGKLATMARERGLDAVHFLGFVNQREIPLVYGMCDLLVLPSTRDHRGTVVNEAMACGLPIVVSDQVGVWGEGDIVREGENGFVFPVGDIDRLAAVLDALVGDDALRERMGRRSREIIGTWNFDADAEGIVASLRAAAGSEGGAPAS
jgi:glycosyltransferase involved in cell wall biosynthesis